MKVIIVGASGMVGQGVLRESLNASEVESVLVLGRRALAQSHPKLRQRIQPHANDYSNIHSELVGYDACFYCLGASANETNEIEYEQINYEYPLALARELVKVGPQMRFVYVSGAGTDATEQGPVRWARVKGKTENALKQLGFAEVYLFRPGLIVPLNGERSQTRAYRLFYSSLAWILIPMRHIFPNWILDTVCLGQAMLEVAIHGDEKTVEERADIHRLAMKRAARFRTKSEQS